MTGKPPVKVLPIPQRMKRLPRDSAGRPVPYFVAWIDDKPDFRVIDTGKMKAAVRFKLCMVCGDVLGANASFVIGPMCSVNRVSAEPPCHYTCATWSAINCPFLANPYKVRREAHLPEDRTAPAGTALLHNPGVTLVWSSRRWEAFKVPTGLLWDIGEPTDVEWYHRGRSATRAEVLRAMQTGLPLLQEAAKQDGPKAMDLLLAAYASALTLIPPNE